MIGFAYIMVLTIFCTYAAKAGAAEYEVGPVPAWVVPVKPDYQLPAPAGKTRGDWFLLSDVQTRIEAQGKSAYYHYANKALDSRGVSGIADISVTFDPTYEKVIIHAINVVRDGTVIDKLGDAKIKVLQRETDLEYRIYDGSKTLSVVLDDLRVGDVVEYAYSRNGLNPVFNNLIAGAAPMQWKVPVGRVFVRLLAPSARPMTVATRNAAPKAELTENGAYRDYRWSQHNMPGLSIDEDAPATYNPYAAVYWSEFGSWKNVVDWGIPLYRPSAPLGPDITAAIRRIRQTAPTQETRLRAVLELVQRDIRYLGIEVGQGSHAPNAPALVFQRRFGDCKDKALLMVAMLRELDVPAAPALVHTDNRSAVAERPPAPHAFNHVIVQARVNGKTYWLDPTRSPQAGDLEHLGQADFGQALLLEEGSSALSPMAQAQGREQRHEVHAVFDGTGGPNKPAVYKIRTTLKGEAAERLRANITANGKSELESDYLNYYARRYPGIKRTSAMEIVDDEKNNTLTTFESYTIEDFWHMGDDGKRAVGYVKSSEVRSRLARPDALNRTAPLAIRFPDEIEEITEVHLAGDWKVTPNNIKVSDAAFEFQHKRERGDGPVTYLLTDRYRALAAEVKPEDVRSFANNLAKADDAVGLTLNLRDGLGPKLPAWNPFARPILVWSALMFVAWLLLRWYDRHSEQEHRWANMTLLSYFSAASGLVVAALVWLPAGWKAQSASLIVAFFGSVMLVSVASRAPETHWLHATRNVAALEQRSSGARLMIQGFSLIPAMIAWTCAAYYLTALFM